MADLHFISCEVMLPPAAWCLGIGINRTLSYTTSIEHVFCSAGGHGWGVFSRYCDTTKNTAIGANKTNAVVHPARPASMVMA
jgi:hypothetical protein